MAIVELLATYAVAIAALAVVVGLIWWERRTIICQCYTRLTLREMLARGLPGERLLQ